MAITDLFGLGRDPGQPWWGFWRKPNGAENPAVPLSTSVLLDHVPSQHYDSSPDGALRLSTVFGCVRVISETIASLPIQFYRRTEDGKERATDHPTYRLLHDVPNEFQTRSTYWDQAITSLLLRGNSYAYIERNGANQPVALIQLDPSSVSVGRVNGRKVYKVDNVPDLIPDSEMVHVLGVPKDGLTGQSPLAFARGAIQFGLAVEEYGSRFYSQGGNPGGVLEHPGKLSTEAATRLRSSWETMHQGVQGSHKVAILEEGLKFNAISVSPEDAQALQTQQANVATICRYFRVPNHMVNDLENAHFANVEHEALSFIQNTIRPYLVRIEEELTRKLVPTADQGTYFVEFLLDSLLRSDIAARYAAYAIGRQQGWLNVDEIRAKENLNPLPGGAGQVFLQALNMTPAVGETKPEPKQDEQGQGDDGTAAA